MEPFYDDLHATNSPMRMDGNGFSCDALDSCEDIMQCLLVESIGWKAWKCYSNSAAFRITLARLVSSHDCATLPIDAFALRPLLAPLLRGNQRVDVASGSTNMTDAGLQAMTRRENQLDSISNELQKECERKLQDRHVSRRRLDRA
jgi:hypothetical protein